jgi:hypothetical protein
VGLPGHRLSPREAGTRKRPRAAACRRRRRRPSLSPRGASARPTPRGCGSSRARSHPGRSQAPNRDRKIPPHDAAASRTPQNRPPVTPPHRHHPPAEPKQQNRSSPRRRPTPLPRPPLLPVCPPRPSAAASTSPRRFTGPAPRPPSPIQRMACVLTPGSGRRCPAPGPTSTRLGWPGQVYLAGRGRESAAQAADSLPRKPRREAKNGPGAGRRPVGLLGPTSRDQQPGTNTKKPTTRGQQGPGRTQATSRSTSSAITARAKAYPTPSCGSSPATWTQRIVVRMSACPSSCSNPARSPVGRT